MRPVWFAVWRMHRRPPQYSVIVVFAITDSLGDGALGLGDPTWYFLEVVLSLVIFVDQSPKKVSAGVHQSFMPPDRTAGLRWLYRPGPRHDIILSEIGQGLVGRRDGTHLVMQPSGIRGAGVGREPSGALVFWRSIVGAFGLVAAATSICFFLSFTVKVGLGGGRSRSPRASLDPGGPGAGEG